MWCELMLAPRPLRGDADIFGTFASPCRWIDAAGALQPTTPRPARTRCLATLTLLHVCAVGAGTPTNIERSGMHQLSRSVQSFPAMAHVCF